MLQRLRKSYLLVLIAEICEEYIESKLLRMFMFHFMKPSIWISLPSKPYLPSTIPSHPGLLCTLRGSWRDTTVYLGSAENKGTGCLTQVTLDRLCI
uniref:Uncharacterized protein n=1 Tax=Anguilla anguilla TaxID=7936 RepID=A0A0E9WWC1_ANGAN